MTSPIGTEGKKKGNATADDVCRAASPVVETYLALLFIIIVALGLRGRPANERNTAVTTLLRIKNTTFASPSGDRRVSVIGETKRQNNSLYLNR